MTAYQVEQGDACPIVHILGGDYKALPGSAMLNKPLRDGGFSSMFDLSFTIVASQFFTDAIPDKPALVNALYNSRMKYLGESYKVVNVHVKTGATMLEINANSLNQKS